MSSFSTPTLIFLPILVVDAGVLAGCQKTTIEAAQSFAEVEETQPQPIRPSVDRAVPAATVSQAAPPTPSPSTFVTVPAQGRIALPRETIVVGRVTEAKPVQVNSGTVLTLETTQPITVEVNP